LEWVQPAGVSLDWGFSFLWVGRSQVASTVLAGMLISPALFLDVERGRSAKRSCFVERAALER
jgi:hypothetical protein